MLLLSPCRRHRLMCLLNVTLNYPLETRGQRPIDQKKQNQVIMLWLWTRLRVERVESPTGYDGHASRNRWVMNNIKKLTKETELGSKFHSFGPATNKAQQCLGAINSKTSITSSRLEACTVALRKHVKWFNLWKKKEKPATLWSIHTKTMHNTSFTEFDANNKINDNK